MRKRLSLVSILITLFVGGLALSAEEAATQSLKSNGLPIVEKNHSIEKVAIIGGGPAGYTAAIYAARAGLSPIVYVGYNPGGQLATTTDVENFPGFPDGIDGALLAENMQKQAEKFGAVTLYAQVEKLSFDEGAIFRIEDSEGKIRYFKTVIVATGSVSKVLDGVKGHKQYWQKGISVCALCDGALPLFRNKPVVVVGGGDSAMEESLHLSKFASKVILVHRSSHFKASKILQQRVFSHPKIEVVTDARIEAIRGDQFLESIEVMKDGKPMIIEAAGLFYAIGHLPNTDLVKEHLHLKEGEVIPAIHETETSIPGLFACGDCKDSKYRQAITAAASGAMAAIDAERYLEGADQT